MENKRLPDPSNRTCDFLGSLLVIFGYEFIGTMMLSMAINSTNGNAVAIGMTLFFLLLLTGPISGGHMNPAVSLGVFLNRPVSGLAVLHLFNAWVAQIFGAFVGMELVYQMLLDETLVMNDRIAMFPHLTPRTHFYWQSFTIEMICTFIFVLSVIIVKDERVGPSTHGGNPWLACFTIAATLTAMIMFAGNHTGGSLNPAISTSQHILANFHFDENLADGFFKVYLMGPIVGGLLAGLVSWAHGNFVARYAGERQPSDNVHKHKGKKEEEYSDSNASSDSEK
jgi:aquaporin Z